jgi:GNAT superfamily N-acetyltransferase
MRLSDGYHDVPAGKVASVVTYLEMRTPADLRPARQPVGTVLNRINNPDPTWYRDLFRRVGGQDWLWFSRLVMDDAALLRILSDPRVEVYTLDRDGRSEGLLELDFRTVGACELAFFGVTTDLIGTGAGRFLMNEAITRAWVHPITLFHVHTCTLDHPGALSFYRRSGFTSVRQQVEIADDPRLTGKLPETAGPHVPVFQSDPKAK